MTLIRLPCFTSVYSILIYVNTAWLAHQRVGIAFGLQDFKHQTVPVHFFSCRRLPVDAAHQITLMGCNEQVSSQRRTTVPVSGLESPSGYISSYTDVYHARIYLTSPTQFWSTHRCYLMNYHRLIGSTCPPACGNRLRATLRSSPD